MVLCLIYNSQKLAGGDVNKTNSLRAAGKHFHFGVADRVS
jgi:hypothetical protein